MKQVITLVAAAAAGGLAVWAFLQWKSPEPSTGSAAVPRPAVKAAAPVAVNPPAPPAITPQARREEGKLPADEALKGQVVVALGKVDDIGRNAGSMLRDKMEWRGLKSLDPATLTPEQRRRLLELERQRAGVLGMLPEIASFQNNPDEYAGFFGSLLTQAAGLDETGTKAVTDYMRSRATQMIAAGLNAAKEPADPAAQAQWEEKRDVFNEDTVAGVAKILPPGEAERIGFTDRFMELLEQDFDKAGE